MSTYTMNRMAANAWMLGTGYGPVVTARTKANLIKRAKNVALFFAAPFVGLAYLLAFPVIGFGLLVWTGAKAMMKSDKARPVALMIAAPFIGLAFVTVGPILGLAAAAWYGTRAALKV